MIRVTLLSLFLILCSCNGQKKTIDTNNENIGDVAKKLTPIEYQEFGGVDEEGILVIRDEKSLKKLYIQLNKTRKPGLPVPQIDFSKELLVVQTSNTMSSGMKMELSIEEETETQLILRSSKSKKEVTTGNVSVKPFGIYRLPLTNKEIVVKER